MLCRHRFSESFQSDDHVYCDLNNSTSDFRLFIEIILDSETVLAVIAQLLYDVINQVDY